LPRKIRHPRENLAGMPSAPPAILRTIAVTSVMGPTIYNVDDRGSAACPGGSPGRALHLTSRDHDPGHRLSDVTIDLKTSRFCMLRFHYSDHVFFNGIGCFRDSADIPLRRVPQYLLLAKPLRGQKA